MRVLALLSLTLFLGCASTPPPIVGARAASFDGVEIAYDARGDGDTALVFVHGWCCERWQWDQAMDAFGDEHRVISIDLAGHGDSGDGREAWSMESFGRDVEAVVVALDLDQVILIGHSMGGPVALAAAARIPERVVGVIGVDTLHDADMKFGPEMIDPFVAALEADFDGTLNRFIDSALPDWLDAELRKKVVVDAISVGQEIGTAIVSSYKDYDPAAFFEACPCPLVCINAAKPNVTAAEHNRAYIEDFEYTLVEDVGHFLMLEQPNEFRVLLGAAITRVQKLAKARE